MMQNIKKDDVARAFLFEWDRMGIHHSVHSHGAKTMSEVIASGRKSLRFPLPPPSSSVLPGLRAFLICPYHFV